MILSESLQLFGIMLYAANGCLTWSRLAMTSDTFGSPAQAEHPDLVITDEIDNLVSVLLNQGGTVFGSPLTAREIASLVAR